MRKLLCILPFILTGCETMSGWVDSAGDYVPDMPVITSEPAMTQQQQPLQATNTNLYTVPRD